MERISPMRELIKILSQERLYVLLFLFVLASFWFFLTLRPPAEAVTDVSFDQTLRRLDEIMELRSQNPAYLEERFRENPWLGRWSQVFTATFFLAIIGGVIMNIGMVRQFIRREPWLPRDPNRVEAVWGLGEVAKSVVLFLACSTALDIIFFSVEPWLPEYLGKNFLLIFHTTAVDALMAYFVFYFIRKQGGNAAESLGFTRLRNWLGEIRLGAKVYCAMLPAFMLILALILFVSSRLGYEPSPHPLAGIFIEEEKRAPWLIGYSIFLGCFLGPAAEELFFRGFLYPAVRKKWGMGIATLLVAAGFAFIHESSFAFLPIFFLGAVLCWLYEKRGNVVSCISLHVLHNVVFISYFFLTKSVLLGEGL